MADLSKNSQVVSNMSVNENVSVCPLISPDSSCGILPADIHKEPELDLIGDGSSLQELIDSELAFRVAGSISRQADADDEDDDEDDCVNHSVDVSCSSNNQETFDVNTQFLMAERKSCFENLNTNATHFFTVIDDEEVDPTELDVGTNGINGTAFDSPLLDVNGSSEYEGLKSPIEGADDSQQESSSSPISPIDADIIKYSSTFGETIVDSAGEEVGDNDIDDLRDPDDDGLMGGPLVGDRRDPQYDPTACDSREGSSEEPSVNGALPEQDEVPFQDFFTPIPEYADDSLDLEFHGSGEIPNGQNGLDNVPLAVEEIYDGVDANTDSGPAESPDNELCIQSGFILEESNGISEENGGSYDDQSPVEANIVEQFEDSRTESDVGISGQQEALRDEPPSQEHLHDDEPPQETAVCATNNDSLSSSSCSDMESNEMLTSSSSEKKIVKKKKKSDGGETKTKKTKKTKKDSEKENISVTPTSENENALTKINTNLENNSITRLECHDEVIDELSNVSVKELKSSFSKFDQLSKKTVLHVRSVDTSKVQKQFNQSASSTGEVTSNCRACGKQVFQMEQIKAERAVWHKNCFRCKECNKQLTVDNYSSNEGVLYCQPHFKELFKPKAVVEDEIDPPSDKPDLGLEELTALNVKSRYHVFEKTESTDSSLERSPSSVSVKRSPSILSKLARFQAKGMDIGVTDESINNIPYEESSSSSEEEQEQEDPEAEKGVIKANRKQRERPMSFNKMGDMKCRWESGHTSKDERREERKQEIQNVRARLFMGKQGKMKEMYEQAVQDSERGSQKKDIDVRCEKAKSIKERFERGEVVPDDGDDDEDARNQKKSKDDDLSVFEEGISKKSRSLFLELDAKTQQPLPAVSPMKSPQIRDESRKINQISPQVSKEVVKASDMVEDVKVETSELFNKFKFFETYKEPEREKKQFRITPPRDGQIKETSPETEIYRDPSVVRSEDKVTDEIVRTKTTSKMLSLFRQMEENATKDDVPEGPKPLKRFTPPPDYKHESESSEEDEDSDEEEEEEEEEEDDERDGNPNLVRASDKVEDEFLKQAATAARAKTLRAKFERWEEKENKLNSSSSGCNLDFDQSDQPSIDSTKSLRAKFESLKNEVEQPKERTRPKVNRFVEIQAANTPLCFACNEKVYPLEKIEASGKIFHKQCFRCLRCNCVLRMETYTFNKDKLYCIPHFKQLFITKGNYEEGFGFDQHKRKWSLNNTSTDIFKESFNE